MSRVGKTGPSTTYFVGNAPWIGGNPFARDRTWRKFSRYYREAERVHAKNVRDAEEWIKKVKARKAGVPVKSGLREGSRIK